MQRTLKKGSGSLTGRVSYSYIQKEQIFIDFQAATKCPRNVLLNGIRNWRLYGSTKEMPHKAKEGIFCPTCWRDYIRWPADRENN